MQRHRPPEPHSKYNHNSWLRILRRKYVRNKATYIAAEWLPYPDYTSQALFAQIFEHPRESHPFPADATPDPTWWLPGIPECQNPDYSSWLRSPCRADLVDFVRTLCSARHSFRGLPAVWRIFLKMLYSCGLRR